MAEKVIFEFRATRDEDGCGFEVRHGEHSGDHFMAFGPGMWACCPLEGITGVHHTRRAKWHHRSRDKVRRNMRETLAFFERMYDDLFGEEEVGPE